MFNFPSLSASRISNTDRMTSIHRSQAIIEFDPTGIILTANENFLACMGYDWADIEGKHHAIFMPSGEADTAEYKAFWKDLAAGKFMSGEFHRVGKNDTNVWIQASYNPVYDASGKVSRILKIASDVTAIKLEAAELAGQIDAINRSQAVIHFDLQGNILDANENFCQTLGYALSDIKGKHHSLFVAEEDKGSAYENFWRDLRNGRFLSGEYRRIGNGQKDVFIQATYNPIFDMSGKPFKVVKFATDVTSQVNRRKEREAFAEQVDQDLISILDAVTKGANDISEISTAARKASNNVETVASGSSQLATSVDEISDQVDNASNISEQAVQHAETANRSIGELAKAAEEINQVIALISDISEQTNLLSLNATIEASRAGEAGKGFAVVASEVKALATQSASATENVSRQIHAVQNATRQAVEAIAAISEVITQINGISGSISGAVDEQANVTRSISDTLDNTTSAVSHISEGVERFHEATELIRTSTEKVKNLSSRMAG